MTTTPPTTTPGGPETANRALPVPIGWGPIRERGRPTRADLEHLAVRREWVERLWLAGYSQRAIAEKVGITVGTVGADLRLIRQALRERVGGQHLQEERDQALARLEQVLADVAEDQDSEAPKMKAYEAMRIRLRTLEQIARLRGLNTPTQVEIVPPMGEGDDEIVDGEVVEEAPTLAAALGLPEADPIALARTVYLQMKGQRAS